MTNRAAFDQEALTFDDVLLVPQKSAVLPSETDISTVLAPTIRLACPLLSAAMDTVTNARLAIAPGRNGCRNEHVGFGAEKGVFSPM